MIHRETVTQVAQNRQRFIDKTAARNLLGIFRKQYDLFTNSGVFARFVPENLPPLVDGQHDAVELKRFVDDIASNSAALEGQTVALQELNLRFTTDTSGLMKVFCRIADGRLRPASCSTGGCLADFQFSSAEVIVEDRAEIEPAPAESFEIGEVGLPELVDGCGLVFELIGGFDDKRRLGW